MVEKIAEPVTFQFLAEQKAKRGTGKAKAEVLVIIQLKNLLITVECILIGRGQELPLFNQCFRLRDQRCNSLFLLFSCRVSWCRIR